MARYISSHTTACMTRQVLEQLVKGMHSASDETVRFVRLRGNLIEGKLIGEFEAPSLDLLTEWFKQQKIHFDWLLRVEFEYDGPSIKNV
ncbi:MAG TPA: hypothetical protein VI756_12985 [Blastocatellia bacterium]